MDHPFDHPLLSIWLGILSRCHVPSHPAFAHYGGRGIKVSPEWFDFRNFLRDMGERPSRQHSVERREVNAGYGPDNCYWATATEQNRNTRRTRWLTYNGETHSLPEWSERTGIPMGIISNRLRRGWTIELAMTTPSKRPAGETRIRGRQADRLCAAAGIAKSTFYSRLKAGWSEERALNTPSKEKRPVDGIASEVSLSTYYARLRWGWTKEEALTTPYRQKPPRLMKLKPTKKAVSRRAHMVTYQGETLSVTEWARRCGIRPTTLFARLRAGMSPDLALTAEPCYGRRRAEATLVERVRAANITISAYYGRLKRGWSKEAALSTPADARYQHRGVQSE